MNESANRYSLKLDPWDALKRDFTTMIVDLNRVGFSNSKIALACDVNEGTVRNWKKKESDVPYHKAIIIIGLHHCYCAITNVLVIKDV